MKKIYLLIALAVFTFGSVLSEDIIKSKKEDFFSILDFVVRSKKVIVKKNPPEKEFIGDVSYKNPYYEFKSDWALAKQLREMIYYAKGNIYAKRKWSDGAVTEAFCHETNYNKTKGIAEMFPEKNGYVKIIHFEPVHGKWESTSKKVIFNEKEKRVDLIGEVNIVSEKNNASAEKISYYYLDDSFKFSGNPIIQGTHKDYEFAVTGKEAVSRDFFNNLEVSGKVKGWIKNKKGDLNDAVKM